LDERRLPDGCEIRFAERSLWRRYAWQIAAALAIIAAQTMLIVTLLTQRRRRRVAEAEVRKGLSEVAHMNRRVSMGELSASIAHELNQPLGAIRNNAGAAEILIKAQPPRLEEVAEILADIKRDDQRASDIITRIRSLLRKSDFQVREIDLNEAIEQIVKLLAGEASARGVFIQAELAPGLPKVSADNVQLQQVILNLALNGMEAMHDLRADRRLLTIRSRRANDREAEISVADSGAGIAEESIRSIFDPFVTTKPGGMGMGLAISRTIIEAHRGGIRAENSPEGGAVFHFTLPFASDSLS
jgi:C4-dicarboxylate-specific signal transduction histidine kinase